MIPAVPDAFATQAVLAELMTMRETGCLTIRSADDGAVCRVYLLMGKPFHAEGPTGEGDSALAGALSWPNVTTSFDDKAQLPLQQTIATEPTPGPTSGYPIFSRLADDRRLLAMGLGSVVGGCLLFGLPLSLALLGAVLTSRGVNAEGLFTAAVIALGVLFVLWIAMFVAFRISFFRDAVKLPGGQGAEGPRVVDAPMGTIGSQPELVITMPTRCTIGRLGRCRIELFAEGLQIWRGPKHPQPHWQISYRDLVQAESVDLVSNTSKGGELHQYFVRLIAVQPPMAFMIGSAWFRNTKVELLVNKLREHGVPTYAETFGN